VKALPAPRCRPSLRSSFGGCFTRGTFLRRCPSAETLALPALKIHTYENARARPDAPELVLEDRGVDTGALDQAAILTGAGAPLTETLADRVYAMAGRWRPAPHRIVLLVDDLSCPA
jgi:dTMP kinase